MESYDDLVIRLRDLESQLTAKENDLRLAAEIGNALLQENNSLKETIASFNSNSQSAADSINDESKNEEVNAQKLKQEKEELVLSTSRKIQRLQDELDVSRAEIDRLVKHGSELEEKNATLVQERAEWVERLKTEQRKSNTNALQKEVDEMMKKVKMYHKKVEETESERDKLLLEAEKWKTRCKEFEDEAEMMLSLQEEYEVQLIELNDCKQALEESQSIIQNLKAQLEIANAREDDKPDHGGKTLFSEVEDRRRELESKHDNLHNKHAGLLKAHKATVYQQERMKNHINRLTQLTQSRSTESKLQRLEASLSQYESENRELQKKIIALEKNLQERPAIDLALVTAKAVLDDSGPANNKDELIECMSIQLEQANASLEKSRKELRTINMMRLSETEKLRKSEAILAERELELDNVRAVLAKTRFDLDELQLHQKLSQEQIQEDESAHSIEIPMKHDENQNNQTKLKLNSMPCDATNDVVTVDFQKNSDEIPYQNFPNIVSDVVEEKENVAPAVTVFEKSESAADISKQGNTEIAEEFKDASSQIKALPRCSSAFQQKSHSTISNDVSEKTTATALVSGPKEIFIRRENVNECKQQ